MEKQQLSLVNRIVYFALPQMRIPKGELYDLWISGEEAPSFIISAISYLLLCAGLYLFAHYAIDIPAHKEPIDLYFRYRYGVAITSALGAGFIYHLAKSKLWLAKLIYLICAGNIVFWQSQSMIWRADVPHFYVFIFSVLGVTCARLSPLVSGLVYALFLSISMPALLTRPQEFRFMISLGIVGFVLMETLRSRMITEVNAHLSHNEAIKSQREKIEAQIALYESINSFLPKVISTRFSNLVRQGHRTDEALEIILKPKPVQVACLYSDIRGFTQKVRHHLNIANEAIFPSQEMAMECVEEHQGVPRPVGDLVFAYFDHADPDLNLKLAIQTGLRIISGQKKLNSKAPPERQIVRYALVSFGDAIVGNGGGKYSSRDIYPIGNPANILSRLDALTKTPELQALITDEDLILTRAAGERIRELHPSFDLSEINLFNLGLSLRDFADETVIYIASRCDHNLELLETKIQSFKGNNKNGSPIESAIV